jgi:mono/diheme cytochrome c family protein
MIKPAVIIASVVATPVALYLLLGDDEAEVRSGQASFVIPTLSAQAYDGQQLFAGSCGGCHGAYGEGSTNGPTLIHAVYAPAELPDRSMHEAMAQGAPARLWPFGDMPAVEGLTPIQQEAIVVFVRDVQRANGIY